MLAYKHLSKLSLSGCFDFDIYIDVAKRKLKEALLICVSDDEFISHLKKNLILLILSLRLCF